MDVRLSIFCLLCLTPTATSGATFKVEAESVSRLQQGTTARSQASNGKTVSFKTTKELLSFPFCLYRQFTDASITVGYFNVKGADTLTVKAGNTQGLTFTTEPAGDALKSEVVQPVSLKRGYNLFTLTFESLKDGIEIDYVSITVNDDFMTEDVFSCQLVTGPEPQLSSSGVSGGNTVHMKQYTTNANCPDEDNIHLPVYQSGGTVSQYTLTATRPLYRSMSDSPTSDDSLNVFWRFENVAIRRDGDSWAPKAPVPNLHNAMVTGTLLDPASQASSGKVYAVAYTASFNLKGCSTGSTGANYKTELKAEFCRTKGSTSSSAFVDVSYVNRQGQSTTVDSFSVEDRTDSRYRQWAMAENTWSEDTVSHITVKVTEKDWTLCSLELIRSNPALELYSDDVVLLQGWRTDMWKRLPTQKLTVTVGEASTTDLFFVAVSVLVPWSGAFQKIMLLYQDGDVHLAPLPHNAPYSHSWTPFGTSVIVGRSNPSDLRPAASIRHMTFYPDTMQMKLDYYDGSSCKLSLTYSSTETKLKVTDLSFPATNADLPFATFRTQFVKFNTTFSDSVQSDMTGPVHVRDKWNKLHGSEFLVYRSVESRHHTHSPDIRLSV